MNPRVSSAARRVLAILVAVHTAALPNFASADSGTWADREICRAAVKTYFFLGAMPADTSDSGKYFGFLGKSGNVYMCRIAGARTEFRWMNSSGNTMTSKSTKFHVRDGILTVQTDMKKERFSTKRGGNPDPE